MIQNAYLRLEADPETQTWWQSVLDHPRFGLVLDAVKVLLEQDPPLNPVGANPMEVFALSHAAGVGSKTALACLERVGSRSMTDLRIKAEQFRLGQEATRPAAAGHGPGRRSTPPPEVSMKFPGQTTPAHPDAQLPPSDV